MYFSAMRGSVPVAHRAQNGQRKSLKSTKMTGASGRPFTISGAMRMVTWPDEGDAWAGAGAAGSGLSVGLAGAAAAGGEADEPGAPAGGATGAAEGIVAVGSLAVGPAGGGAPPT